MSKDILQFARALDFAAKKHIHQRRKGELEEPYINHLADVSRLLAAATESRDTSAGWFDIQLPPPGEIERGGIVGQSTILDCVENHDSPWFFGPYGFVLDQSKPLPFRPMRGRLGFFPANE